MRKLCVFLLLLLVVATPALAFSPREGYYESVVGIAWLEGRALQVALGNPANTRATVTISTPTLDAWGRPVFTSRRVTVPGRTIIQESFTPETPRRRGEKLEVVVTEGYRVTGIEVQQSEILDIENYIVPAGREWEVSADLSFLLDSADGTRFVIDDYYRTDEGYYRGAITLSVVEGGLRQVRFSNTIEYVRPRVELKLNTPALTGLTTLTFSMWKTGSGYGWREEEIPGPTILVYGRNIRFKGAPTSSDSGRVKY